MIYIDSCIPMYIVGGRHNLKERTLELLPNILDSREQLVTSAEVFQEILHRYKAINEPRSLNGAYESLEELVTDVFDVKKEDVDQARTLLVRFPKLSSRDCLHAAVMRRNKCNKIWSYDSAFDEVGYIRRVS